MGGSGATSHRLSVISLPRTGQMFPSEFCRGMAVELLVLAQQRHHLYWSLKATRQIDAG